MGALSNRVTVVELEQWTRIESMAPKKFDRSVGSRNNLSKTLSEESPTKGTLKALPRTLSLAKQPTRTSPRNPPQINSGAISKSIAKKPTTKKKDDTVASNAKGKTVGARFLDFAAALKSSPAPRIEAPQTVKNHSTPKPALNGIGTVVSKTEEHLNLFGQVQEPQQFKLGDIISVASHTEVYQDAKNMLKLQDTREQTLTTLGWVYSKARKIVVVDRYSQHLVGLPIYSHRGKGLEKKDKSEFVGIRDTQHFGDTSTDSAHPTLLSHRIEPFIQVNKSHWSVINGDSYVQFTRPLSVAYNTRCTIEGHLEEQDLKSLIELSNSKQPTCPADTLARTAPKLMKLG